jgi:hypothetical protein
MCIRKYYFVRNTAEERRGKETKEKERKGKERVREGRKGKERKGNGK